MNDKEIIELVNTALAEEFELEIEDMKPEASLLDNLGLDSLDRVDMVIVLENQFNFKVREEETIRQIRTLGDIHDFVITKKHEIGSE